jgi:hypothetical protein
LIAVGEHPLGLAGQSVWERSLVRQLLVTTVAVKVTGLVLVFDWSGKSLHPFDLMKSLWSRSFEWLIASLLLIALVRFGTVLLPRSRLHFAVAAILVVNVASALVAEDRYVALFGTEGRYLGLSFLGDMAVLYVAVAIAFRTIRDWMVLGVAIAIAGFFSGAYAWAQFGGLDPLPWTESARVRPFATIGNPNTYGHFLSVVLGSSAGLSVLYVGRAQVAIRAVGCVLAFAALLTAGIVATRGTMLGILSAFVLLPLLFLRIRGATSQNRALVVAGLGIAVILVGATLALSPLGTRVIATLELIATRDRLLVYEASLRAFLDRPVLGYGPDNFGVAWPLYRGSWALQLGSPWWL